ncbi:MAG: T9SS type A sorting domain-containing protein [Bacteroidales bacterium]|nr:T9SS type A sorting domain-containing protein [Bacteroidales bacterium]
MNQIKFTNTIISFCLLALLMASSLDGWGQTTIAMQDFDGTNTLTYTVTGGTTYTGNSASADRPASSAFYLSSSTAYGVSNGTATLTFGNVTGLDAYTAKFVELRLASWSISSSGNGADATDNVILSISVDNGVNWSQELRINGNANAYWHYTTGTGAASTTYDGDDTPTTFAPAGGANRTTDGYSTLLVNLPNASTQVRIKVVMLNNSTNERWTIDNVRLVGTPTASNTITTGSVSTPPFCIDASNPATGTVAYTSTGTYAGATFTAKLSDATGAFDAPVSVGTASVTGTDPSGNISISIPAGTASGTGYKIRIDCASPAVTGTISAPFEIVNGAKNVTNQAATIDINASTLSWTNPNACYDEIMIVGKASTAVTAIPTGNGTAYTADLNFGVGTAFDGGYVLYKGITSTQFVTGLTNGTTYYYTFFTRYGTNWSTGATANATPAQTSNATDYFRSKITGNWGDYTSWESSTDNTTWISATLAPTSTANTITIRNAHTITIAASRTADQVVIQNGGILIHSAGTFTINDGLDNDIIIESGGIFSLASTAPVYSTGASTLVSTGGTLRIAASGLTGNGAGVNAASYVYQDASILEYTITSSFSASGVTYFPNVDQNTKPIFRVTSIVSPTTPGGGSNTVINGIFEANSTFSFTGGGTKTFRNGIRGTGVLSQGASTGQFIINGTTADISGADSLKLGPAGLSIASGSAVTVSSNKLISGGPVTIDGSLTINSNAALTVTGTLTNNAGTSGLVLKSGASGTGSLIHNTNNVDATIERYITGSTNLSSKYYHNVSIPLNSSVQSSEFTGSYLFSFNQATQLWEQITASNVTLSNTEAYMIFYPNTSTTYNFAGQLNNGLFTATTAVGSADQFCLVPNPYPCAIDWDAASGWTKTNLYDAIWVWNPVSQTYATYGSYTGVNGGSRYIPEGQGFFVKNAAVSPALSMDNGVRVHNSQAFFDEPILSNLLRISSHAATFSDEIVVRFQADASIGFDANMDIDKLRGSQYAPLLYSIADGRELCIQSLPFSTETMVVPIGFSINTDGEQTLEFSGLESFETGTAVFLEDLLTGDMIDLAENSQYTFLHSTGNSQLRFRLHFMGVTGQGNASVPASESAIWSYGNNIYLNLPESTHQPVSVAIYDASGRLLAETTARPGQLTMISAASLQGVVIVRIAGQQGIETKKVYISK